MLAVLGLLVLVASFVSTGSRRPVELGLSLCLVVSTGSRRPVELGLSLCLVVSTGSRRPVVVHGLR